MGRSELRQGRGCGWGCGLWALCAVLLLGGQASAQEAEVTPGDDVLELINEGAAASDAGEYWRAVAALERALKLQPLNVAYLNLGRALQKSGKCFEAKAAYDAVAGAPKVAGVDPATIAGYVDKYVVELEGACPGRLRFLCAEPATVVLVDPAGALATEACGEWMVGSAGDYAVLATTEDGREVRTRVTVAALETREVPLTFEATVPEEGLTSGVGLRIGVRYASIVGYGTGELVESDGATALDRLPADGLQDELDGLQIARLGHGVEGEVGYDLGGSWVGMVVQLRFPASSVVVTPFFELGLTEVGSGTLGLRVHAGYGEVQQAMRAGDERFLALAGPVQAGTSLRLELPLSESLFLSSGLGLTVGFPDLGVYGGLDGGVDFRF